MITTSTKKDSPGVFIPPPLIYVAVFLISMVIQQIVPLDRSFFYSAIAANLSIVFILCALIFGVSAFKKYDRSDKISKLPGNKRYIFRFEKSNVCEPLPFVCRHWYSKRKLVDIDVVPGIVYCSIYLYHKKRRILLRKSIRTGLY